MSITLEDIRTALTIVENTEGSEITLRSGDIELIVGVARPALLRLQSRRLMRHVLCLTRHTAEIRAPRRWLLPRRGLLWRGLRGRHPPPRLLSARR